MGNERGISNKHYMKVPYPQNYSQFDPKWNTVLLGFNTDPKFDFNNYACLLCQLADVCQYFGYDETPLTLNEKLKQVTGFVNGGEYVDGSLSRIFPEIFEKAVPTPNRLTDEQMKEIADNVNTGNPVVLGIDYNPKTIAADFHFVGAVDIDGNDENDIEVADSLGGRFHSLKDYLGFTKPSARDTIQKYFVFTSNRKPVQTVSNPTPEIPAAPVAPVSALPENYPQIIHDATEWDNLSKKFAQDVSPDQLSAADLEDRIRKQLPVQTVTKEVIKEVPVNIAPDGSSDSKWSQTVDLLGIGKQPNDASFDDAKRVIAGIKSRQTDLQNKTDEVVKESSGKDVTIEHQNTVISTLNKQVLQDQKINKAETDSLKKNIPNFDSLKRQYQTVIDSGRAELDARSQELLQVKTELAHIQGLETAAADVLQTAQANGTLERIRLFLMKFIKL